MNFVGEQSAAESRHLIRIQFCRDIRIPFPGFNGKFNVCISSIHPGSEVTLSCEVDSNPRPDIVWLREGSVQVLGKQASFVIRNMEPADAGKYICRATVPGFQVSKHSLFREPPKQKNRPSTGEHFL